ncbi:MAG TPA: FAD-dependent monooxygenase [Burkholderiales bacterium]
MNPRAIVIGGSLGGLFAANLLADLGWEVRVFEKVGDDLAARGAGIGTHTPLIDVLAGLGIRMDERLGLVSGDRVCLDRAGNVLYRRHWAHTMSAWANVYRPLKDRFAAQRYFFNRNFVSFAEEKDCVVARFDDGSEARGDLLIGADGLRSAVRSQIFPAHLYPEAEPAYCGYVAWRSIVDEEAIPAASRAWLKGGYWFVLPPNEMFLSYEVPSKDPLREPGRRDWNYVWYRPVDDQAFRELCTDASGRQHQHGIPPPLIRPEAIARFKQDARALLAPHVATLVESSQPFFQPIYDVESPRLASGRVVLLGDAAFVARPHIGAGVTKAALDALCLSNSLKANPGKLQAALARYDRLRSEYGRACVARGRRLGSYIEARSRPERKWTPEQLDQRPERVLSEVALALDEIPELALEV